MRNKLQFVFWAAVVIFLGWIVCSGVYEELVNRR